MKKLQPASERLLLGAGMALIATVAYRSIQWAAVERAVVRDTCWTWQWLPFSAAWVWPYVSMFALVGLPWFLLPEISQVRRFAVALLATAATGWIVFLVHPTACARPGPEGQPEFYALLLALDRPNNCLPCLHSAFSVLAVWALAWSAQIFRSPLARLALGGWLAAISVSIVALRQHTDVDMAVGLMLGAVAAWWWTPARS